MTTPGRPLGEIPKTYTKWAKKYKVKNRVVYELSKICIYIYIHSNIHIHITHIRNHVLNGTYDILIGLEAPGVTHGTGTAFLA